MLAGLTSGLAAVSTVPLAGLIGLLSGRLPGLFAGAGGHGGVGAGRGHHLGGQRLGGRGGQGGARAYANQTLTSS